jgi:hypothetical protein
MVAARQRGSIRGPARAGALALAGVVGCLRWLALAVAVAGSRDR